MLFLYYDNTTVYIFKLDFIAFLEMNRCDDVVYSDRRKSYLIRIFITEMRNKHKSQKFINILICFALLVCALYHEPVSVPDSYGEGSGSLNSGSMSICTVQTEREILAENSNNIISCSIREISPRRISGRNLYDTDGLYIEQTKYDPIRILSTVVSVKFVFGADTLFRNILSFIWSQIGL